MATGGGAGPTGRARWPARWPAGLRYSVVVYGLTRIPQLVALILFAVRHPRAQLTAAAVRWDGWWYVRIASHGYDTSLHPSLKNATDWHHNFSSWAFYPGYPAVVAGVHALTRMPYVAAAVTVSAVSGLLAVWAVHRLGDACGGPDVARGAALLTAAFPGSAVFGQAYAEGLFVAAAAMSLACLARERWVAAGLFGAAACFTRPSGLALVGAGAVVAAVHLVRRRDARPLLMPVLAAAGAGAFVAYGWLRTGDPLVWRHAENLWTQRLDLWRELLKAWWDTGRTWRTLMHTEIGRATVVSHLVEVAGLVPLLVLAVVAVRMRRRLTLPLAVYTGITLALIVGYTAVGPRPRTELALFPAAVWAAGWWPRRLTLAVAVACAPLIGVVTYLYLWRVTP